MKGINFILILLLTSTRIFATSQIPDILIYKGDTLNIFTNPLEQLYSNDSIKSILFGTKEGCNSTACWRGYQAEWIIIDENLYLNGIYSCCYNKDSIKADLRSLFGDKFINRRVKADWFNGNIIAPQGKLLYYVHMGYESLFEMDLELQFKNGILIGTHQYDNSKSKQSDYSQYQEKLVKFIYSNIKWNTLPKLDNKFIKVIVQFSANEKGIVDSVKVIKGYNRTFDIEAIRIIKSIPEWDVYYRHGRLQRMNWTIPILFSKSNRRRYLSERKE